MMRFLQQALLSLLLVPSLAGCSPEGRRGADAGVPPDGGETDGGAADGGPSGPSVPSPPAEVLRAGSGGFLLQGVVLTPTEVLDPGQVLVVGDTITCVAQDCSGEPAADTVTFIDTHGVISPGLIDAHNHVAYDFLPEWIPEPARLFGNRYEWAADPGYRAFVLPYGAHRSTGTHYCPAAKWGELRAIVHGTTTIQGESYEQGCVDRLARNADHHHGLGYDHMQTAIASVREFTDADAQGYVDNFLATTDPITRLAVHMAEGTMGDGVDLELDSFAGRDTRMNRHFGVSLMNAMDGSYRGTAILIHAVPLTEAQLMEVLATDSHVVWSPSSNIVLYGATAPIGRMLELGINVGLGPDWTPSGEDDMLAEMRFALAWGQAEGVTALTPERLWRMATTEGARVVGLEAFVGRLVPGLRADIAVFGRTGPDPFAAVVESDAADVRLLLVNGSGLYGDMGLEAVAAVNGECEVFDACGASMFLCVRNTPGSTSRADETYEDIRTQLFNILEGIGYPPEEQYGRGSELLPLVTCGG